MLKSGFTLIELLVVIAIIGLLASIVLLNLQGPRFQAYDVNIKSYLHQVRNSAELDYTRDENYTDTCAPDNTLSDSGELKLLEDAIQRDNNGQPVTCYASVSEFAVSSPLRLGNHWCIESAGLSIEIADPITSTKCVNP